MQWVGFLILILNLLGTSFGRGREYCKSQGLPKHATVQRLNNTDGGATELFADVYSCHAGFRASHGHGGVFQLNGTWDGFWSCANGNILWCNNKQNIDFDCFDRPENNGDLIHFHCQTGAVIHADGISTCSVDTGMWSVAPLECVPKTSKFEQGCSEPADFDHAHYSLQGKRVEDNRSLLEEGSLALYRCDSGFAMLDAAKEIVSMKCSEGLWKGDSPICVSKKFCESPEDVPNGNWVILKVNPDYTSYGEKTKILYECDDGYELFGNDIIECQQSGYWNKNPPQCLLKDSYCEDPGDVPNGYYICTPSNCNMFSRSTSLHFLCHEGFEPEGDVWSTCSQDGQWTNKKPACVAVDAAEVNENSEHHLVSTSVIVAAASCGIFLLLLLIMGIIVCQRNIILRDLSQLQVNAPAATQSVLDQQHLASYLADKDTSRLLRSQGRNSEAVLPSYEEAVRTPARASVSTGKSASRHNNATGDSVEFRPLPRVNESLRSCFVNSNNNTVNGTEMDENTRAMSNTPVAFGSLDTVNTSDGASTIVTVGTLDSAVSMPSMTPSQHGLSSLDDELVDGDDIQLISNDGEEDSADLTSY